MKSLVLEFFPNAKCLAHDRSEHSSDTIYIVWDGSNKLTRNSHSSASKAWQEVYNNYMFNI